ncbi:MAG: GNAT family N-acetyltransferase [Streptosporangiaceae bacterium]
MRDLRIEPCQTEHLDLLEAGMPSGPSRFHHGRLARQEQGVSTYLIAWIADVPHGHAEVRWDGGNASEVTSRFPGCVMINALDVWPAPMRSHGIGTALICEAERQAQIRGFGRIGLGVADDNPRAAALYLRLGYGESGCRYPDRYEVVDDTGTCRIITEPCRFLVKELHASQTSRERS